MANFVVDANVAVGTVILSQSNDYSDGVLAAFDRCESALVPALWHLETTNAVLVRERRRSITAEIRELALAALARHPIETDVKSADNAVIAAVQSLALRCFLTAYDAAYLELAHRTKLPIATCDGAISQAAKHLGVPLFV